MTAAIVCSDLTFAWPDGDPKTPVLSGLTASFGPGRTGLIGVNGSGKSTLLRLIAGDLRPGSAAVVRRERRDLVDAQVKQARRDRQGRKLAASGSMPKIVAHARQRSAQETAGRSRELHAERLQTARDRLADAEHAVRDDAEIRVALTGPNGAGKTTLLRAIAGLAPLPGVGVRLGAVVGYLPQRLDILNGSLTVVDNVRAAAPAASVNEVRASLARFLFRGERADRLAGTLSGGERFRAVLAALLLAKPAPQLLLLDEPTNNLEMASVRQLSLALEGYRGAVLVASHDLPFLRLAGITRWLRLSPGLTVIEPL